MWPYVFFVGIVGAILRLYSIIPNRNRRKQPRNGRPIKTLVVLGSGGHTTEMCAMVQSLQQNPIYRFEYVVAETDDKSPTFAQLKLAKEGEKLIMHKIPRSREVKQPMLSSVRTTIWSIFATIKLTLNVNPDLILVNGPGTCIPICLNAYILRFFGRDVRIIYVESNARVTRLSTSGKIMYHLADRFLVQWPQLADKKAEYKGKLC